MKTMAITAGIALLLGGVIRIYTGAEVIGTIMLLLLVVLPLVGLFITIDDDLPGGFGNPDGKAPPLWKSWENWADVAIRGALCGIGFAIDKGWRTQASIVPWAISICAMAVLVIFGRRIYRKR